MLRGLLAGGAVVAAGAAVSACCSSVPAASTSAAAAQSATSTPAVRRVLLAYFSRPGENYYYGGRRDLEVGSTEVLARMIADRTACDVHRIQAAAPYPAGYDATVARNVREQDDDTRPAIANPLSSIDGYDMILLGSPIRNVRAPMIMTAFTERLDFRGKPVVPFTTYVTSGPGTTERDYAASCPGATIADGLAAGRGGRRRTRARRSGPVRRDARWGKPLQRETQLRTTGRTNPLRPRTGSAHDVWRGQRLKLSFDLSLMSRALPRASSAAPLAAVVSLPTAWATFLTAFPTTCSVLALAFSPALMSVLS